MFSTFNDDGISPMVASSSSLASMSCPGTCGWRPPPAATTTTTTTAFSANLSAFGGANDSAWPPIAPGDDAAMVQLIFAHCKPCPWGTRRPSSALSSRTFSPFSSSLCHPCEMPLSTIDYLFLLFHAILPFVVNHAAISYHSAKRLRHSRRLFLLTLCQLCSSLLECSLAFVFALLLFPPFGQLHTFGCVREGKLVEWYSLFNNPVLHYTRVLHCSSELVYPLFSLPFVIYALNLLTLLSIRSLLHFVVASLFNTFLPVAPFYGTLWALPLLALAHAVLSGVLHALFPFIALLVALLHLVVHLSAAATANSATTVGKMFRLLLRTNNNTISRKHHNQRPHHYRLPLWLSLLVHVALFAFALFTLFVAFGAPNSGQLDELIDNFFGGNWPIFLLILCVLLPVPTLFFILTIRLTAPAGIVLTKRRLLSE